MKRQNYKPQLINQEESYNPKSIILIIGIIVALFVAFYFITTIVLKNKKSEDIVTESIIKKDNIMFGQLLNRNESEYYVLAYKEDSKFNEIYNNYIKTYNEKEDALSIYKINLSDGFNKSYLAEETNVTDEINKLTVSDETLFKISDGKIDTYNVGYDEIIETLKEISK